MMARLGTLSLAYLTMEQFLLLFLELTGVFRQRRHYAVERQLLAAMGAKSFE